MKSANGQRMGAKLTGLAGFFALFSQLMTPGPTVDFKPVDNVFQTDEPLRPEPSTDLVAVQRTHSTPATQGRIVMNRYVQRSRFDGRGGILDAYS